MTNAYLLWYALTIGTALTPALAIGCSTPSFDNRLGVQQKGPHEYMFVGSDGHKAWYSALEFDQIARRYAQEKKLQFAFEGTETNIWVRTNGGRVLADVCYSSGIGKYCLQVSIDREGQVIGHSIDLEVCGVTSR